MFGIEYSTNSEVDLKGIFIALVVDNADPKALERIKIRVLGVHDMENENPDNSLWASHIAPSKSASGELPDKDDFVYVQFLQGDPMNPLWIGWCRVLEG
jgi:hypothetical protein